MQATTPLSDQFARLQAAIAVLDAAEMAVPYYDPYADTWRADDPSPYFETDDGEEPEPEYLALEAAWADVWAIVQELAAAGHHAEYEEGIAEPEAVEGLSFVGTYECAIVFGAQDFARWTHKVRGDAQGGSSGFSLFHYSDEPDLPKIFWQRMGFERMDGLFPSDYDRACRWAGLDEDEDYEDEDEEMDD